MPKTADSISLHLRAGLVCAAAFAALTALVAVRGLPSRSAFPGDLELVAWALSLRTGWLTTVVQGLSFLSSAAPALAMTLLVTVLEWMGHKRRPLSAAWAVLALAGAAACNVTVRVAMARLRPAVDYIPNLLPEIQTDWQRFSYPSGHATAAVVLCGAVVALAWPRPAWRWTMLLLAVVISGLVGFGRVYLGVHWPSDVVGGYLLSGVWLGLGLAWRRWAAKPGER